LKRNAVRDYLDFAALANHLQPEQTMEALAGFDTLYPQKNGESALIQLQIQLAEPLPYDFEETNITEYKNLKEPWTDWKYACKTCADIAIKLFDVL
jgi:hypothetical protein